jgi:hypothetical protein
VQITRIGFIAGLFVALLVVGASADEWGYQVVQSDLASTPVGISHATINGHPAMSYIDVAANALVYARLVEGKWEITRIAGVGMPRGVTSLAEVNGAPAIAYQDDYMLGIHYAWLGSEGWSTQTVWASQLACCPSLAVNDGVPGIAFFDGGLKYAVRVLGQWSTVDIDQQVEVGGRTSLVYVYGMYVICYYADGDLRLARQMESGPEITTLDSEGDVGQYCSAALVDAESSRVGVSYYDATHQDLKYVEVVYGDMLPPVTVDATDDVGRYSSLAVLPDGPAIAYCDTTNSDLKFARRDADGWHIRRLPSQWEDMGQYASLAVADGLPSIGSAVGDMNGVVYATGSNLEGRAVTLTALPKGIRPNETSALSAFVSTADGPAAGVRVDFEVSWTNCGAELESVSADTDASGIATVTLNAGETAGAAEVSATPEGWTETARETVEVGNLDPMLMEFVDVEWRSDDTGETVTGTVRVTNVGQGRLTLIEATQPLLDVAGAEVVFWGLPDALTIYEPSDSTEAPFEFHLPPDTAVFHCYVTFATTDWSGRRRGHDRDYQAAEVPGTTPPAAR